jgi:GNAT superfamily N-acetyltransferase
MEIQTLDGLVVALVDAGEALTTDWRAFCGRVDVARVTMPPARRRAELAEAGFLAKPARLTWIAACAADQRAFLATLTGRARRNLHVAGLRAEADRVRFSMVEPVTSAFLTEFLELYEARVKAMRNGVAIASQHKDHLLSGTERYYAVTGRVAGELVGACLAQELPGQDTVRLRFSAAARLRQRSSLGPLLYLEAIAIARDKGYRHVSLGTDPNLFGHLVKPGLFAFKWRLGFTAVPSQEFIPGDGFDEADLIISTGRLAEPVLFLSHDSQARPGDGARGRLRAELFSSDPSIDTRPYAAPFLAGLRLHRSHAPAEIPRSRESAATGSPASYAAIDGNL